MDLLRYLLSLILLIVLFWALSRWWKGDAFNKLIQGIYLVAFCLIFIEIGLNILFKVESQYWLFMMKKNHNAELFTNHPYTSVANRENVSTRLKDVKFTHDKDGNRITHHLEKLGGESYRIVTIGGSTTYGVGVDDNDTWPYLLDSLLGPDTTVFNLSVPGHSSVENLVTLVLYVEEYQPDLIILHAGLNDLRVSHVNDLKMDYQNFHEPHLIGSMGLCYIENLPKVASVYYSIRFMQQIKWYPICDFHAAKVSGQETKGIDNIALGIYKKNLKKMIYLSEYQSTKVIVIPQVIIPEMVSKGQMKWWIPFIPNDELAKIVRVYNSESERIADSMGVDYLTEVDDYNWKVDDFADPSHLNAKGNLIFTRMIINSISKRDSSLTED